MPKIPGQCTDYSCPYFDSRKGRYFLKLPSWVLVEEDIETDDSILWLDEAHMWQDVYPYCAGLAIWWAKVIGEHELAEEWVRWGKDCVFWQES